MVKASDTGGVKPMNLEGRLGRERERLLGMTEEERAYRRQWVKDQELSPNEPRFVPELYKERYNIIRRFYRYPLDQLGKALEPVLGPSGALKVRYFTGKGLMGIYGAVIAAYYFNYNTNDWTRKGGFRVYHSRAAVVEGDPGYPRLSDRKVGADYASRGFKDVKLDL